MKEMQEIHTVEKVVVAIVCDRCGRRSVYDGYHKGGNDLLETQEYVSISFTGGYRSIFGDGESYSVDLCQYCVRELIGRYLKHNSNNNNNNNNNNQAVSNGKDG